MRIAIISPWNPWPVDSGSRQRADLIIRGLAASHDVFAIYGLQQPFHGIPALESAPANVAQFLTFRWPRGETEVTNKDGARSARVDLRPRDIQRMHTYIPEITGPLATFKPDVLLALEADGALIATAQKLASAIPIIVDQWEPSRIVDARLVTRLRSTLYWRSVMQCASAVTVVTNTEAVAAQRVLGGCKRVCVAPNDAVRPQDFVRNPEPLTILFTGNLDYQPNRDGILWFIAEVLPIIQKKMSGVQLQIVGRGAPLCPSGLPDGVTQRGWVHELSACYGTASIAINPVRSGHGSRVKNQCAMVHGVPLVTFPDGHTTASPTVACVALSLKTAENFAEACLCFLQTPPATSLAKTTAAGHTTLVTTLENLLRTAAGVNA
ncbi:MAG: hypothetical protein RLZZ78_750 [Armatimonadota bacterium]